MFPTPRGRLALPALLLAFAVSPAVSTRAQDVKPEAAKSSDAPKSTEAQKPKPKPKVAVFRLSGPVTELPPDSSFSLSLNPIAGASLRDLVERLAKAAKDPEVKAVVVLADNASIGSAQTEELRQALAAVKEAGKPIYAHSDSMQMGQYLLLSGATRLSMVPTADLWLTGMYAEAPYLRGLLDKLGVRPDYLTCGDYKSAAEIYLRTGPSPEAERMQNWLLDSIFESGLKLIAEGRGVDADKARSWVDNGPYTAEKAKAAGIINAVEHRQDFEAKIKAEHGDDVVFDRAYGKKVEPKPDFSSPFAIFKLLGDMMNESSKKKSTKPAVGIVYVAGAIEIGGNPASNPLMGGESAKAVEIRKALDAAAADDAIKAVVLRVDSPGGSAVASEIILDATKRVKAKKPFVVSMGDVAGSGGYYVACASDVIYADAATITASIGVVGGKFATKDLWDKLGIHFKEYKRGAHAGLLNMSEPFSDEERKTMQAWMDDIYAVFKGHVLAARGDRLKKPIDELAGGRVFTGKQALELGLVDKIGTLRDAIAHVADKAGISDYEVRAVPEPKNFLEKLLEDSADADANRKGLGAAVAGAVAGESLRLVDLALPHLKGLDPARVDLVLTALRRMQLLQREGVLVQMPEIRIGR